MPSTPPLYIDLLPMKTFWEHDLSNKIFPYIYALPSHTFKNKTDPSLCLHQRSKRDRGVRHIAIWKEGILIKNEKGRATERTQPGPHGGACRRLLPLENTGTQSPVFPPDGSGGSWEMEPHLVMP